MHAFSFRKRDRLCSRKDIQELFEKGSSFYLYPFKVYFLHPSGLAHDQVLISVSSRNFKRAVDRNLIKRRIRESYRVMKRTDPQSGLHIGLVYSTNKILTQQQIHSKLSGILTKLTGLEP